MKLLRIAAVFLLLGATPAVAASFGGVEEFYAYPSIQYFSWEEFFNGRRVLTEEGALFGAGAAVDLNLLRTETAGSLKLKGRFELFGGEVHYRGETTGSTPLPVRTDVDYFGSRQEVDLGWRFPGQPLAIEPFAGLGYRWWLRDIQDSTTLNGTVRVQGYEETWQTLYTRLGGRASWTVNKDLRILAEGGAKYPFYNRNEANFPGVGRVALEPGKQWSAFAEVAVRYRRFRPSFFYEGFRFSQSSTVPVSATVGLLQPKSESDIFGINFAWAFR